MVTIFIGKEFKYKKFLQNYIFSKFSMEKIYFFDNVDFEIEEIISKYKEILVIVNEKLYSTIAKIIATLNNDTLTLRDNYLLPNKILLYEKNSFLLEIDNRLLNIVKITDFIPNILLEQEEYTFHIFNYDVDSANLFIQPIFKSFNIDYTIYMNEGGWCEIKTAKISEKLVEQLKSFIPHIIVDNSIFQYLQYRLKEKKATITFAESCTGGLISSYFTKIAGSSSIFDGSVITYANHIKNEWLGVDNRVLEKFGAVSQEVVQQMLLGVLDISNSDFAIAVSGIAGPSGATINKPVGTIFIGVGDKNGKFIVERLNLNGSREDIQYQTLMHSIRIFMNFFNF